MMQSKAKIQITDGDISENEKRDIIQEKTQAIIGFFLLLKTENSEFDEKKAFDVLLDYIKSHDRILYAPISNEIYDQYNKNTPEVAERTLATISSNMEKLTTYTWSEEYKSKLNSENADLQKHYEDTRKAILKIWDHINLAQQQYSVLKQSDSEYKEKFEKLISTYKEDMTKDMSNQLLTMVSIFTALAFLVFGGISSLDNIFSSQGIPLLKLMCIGSVWGLCILNLVFVFLFCVSKMTHQKFESTDNPNADIFERYAIVWWTNLTILAIL